MLTGSNADGTLAAGQTCGDWTLDGEGTAMLGHHDRMGPDTLPTAASWNAAHPSRVAARPSWSPPAAPGSSTASRPTDPSRSRGVTRLAIYVSERA